MCDRYSELIRTPDAKSGAGDAIRAGAPHLAWGVLNRSAALSRRSLGRIGVLWVASAVLGLAVAGCVAPGGRGGATRPEMGDSVQPDIGQDREPSHRQAFLPGMMLDHRTKEIQIEGQVCIDEGILEYVAVADGGKTYESLFMLHVRPSQLHVAMLLAGYKTGEVEPMLRGDFSPRADSPVRHSTGRSVDRMPQGAPRVTPPPPGYWEAAATRPTGVTIDVDIRQTSGAWQRRSIEDFLIDRSTGRPPRRLTWAFTGSFFHRDERTRLEHFVADVEKSLIALWYDPTCLLNLTRAVGNPYRAGSIGLEANAAALPEKGTQVRLILRPVTENHRNGEWRMED